MNRYASNLAEKLDALTPDQIDAVEDFVESCALAARIVC